MKEKKQNNIKMHTIFISLVVLKYCYRYCHLNLRILQIFFEVLSCCNYFYIVIFLFYLILSASLGFFFILFNLFFPFFFVGWLVVIHCAAQRRRVATFQQKQFE